MTFLELQDQVLQELEESTTTPIFHLRSFVREALNNGYRAIAEATEFYVHTVPVSMTANQLQVAVSDIDDNGVLGILRVRNAVTKWWMRFETFQFMDAIYRLWTAAAGQPEILVPRGFDTLQAFPQPSTSLASGLEFTVSALPPDMQGDGEEPLFPRQFHRALVEYACYELLLQEKEVGAAMDRYGEYQAYAEKLKTYVAHNVSRMNALGPR